MNLTGRKPLLERVISHKLRLSLLQNFKDVGLPKKSHNLLIVGCENNTTRYWRMSWEVLFNITFPLAHFTSLHTSVQGSPNGTSFNMSNYAIMCNNCNNVHNNAIITQRARSPTGTRSWYWLRLDPLKVLEGRGVGGLGERESSATCDTTFLTSTPICVQPLQTHFRWVIHQ